MGCLAASLLNVNIPSAPADQLQGALITRQARARWEEEFEERTDPFDEVYYWLSGRFVDMDGRSNTDLWAIDNGYVSITPMHHDLTANEAIASLAEIDWL